MNHLGTVTMETERLLLRPFVWEDREAMFRTVDAALAKELAALDKLKGPALAKQRYDMFRAMGQNLSPAGKEEP